MCYCCVVVVIAQDKKGTLLIHTYVDDIMKHVLDYLGLAADDVPEPITTKKEASPSSAPDTVTDEQDDTEKLVMPMDAATATGECSDVNAAVSFHPPVKRTLDLKGELSCFLFIIIPFDFYLCHFVLFFTYNWVHNLLACFIILAVVDTLSYMPDTGLLNQASVSSLKHIDVAL